MKASSLEWIGSRPKRWIFYAMLREKAKIHGMKIWRVRFRHIPDRAIEWGSLTVPVTILYQLPRKLSLKVIDKGQYPKEKNSHGNPSPLDRCQRRTGDKPPEKPCEQ